MSQPYLVGCCCAQQNTCWYLAEKCECSSANAPNLLGVPCPWLEQNYPNGLTFQHQTGGFGTDFPCYEVSLQSKKVPTLLIGDIFTPDQEPIPEADPDNIAFFGPLGQCIPCCGPIQPCSVFWSGAFGSSVQFSASGFDLHGCAGTNQVNVASSTSFPMPFTPAGGLSDYEGSDLSTSSLFEARLICSGPNPGIGVPFNHYRIRVAASAVVGQSFVGRGARNYYKDFGGLFGAYIPIPVLLPCGPCTFPFGCVSGQPTGCIEGGNTPCPPPFNGPGSQPAHWPSQVFIS